MTCDNGIQARSGFQPISFRVAFVLALIVVVVLCLVPAAFKARASHVTKTPSVASSTGPLDHSHGQKSLLFIRARFPDDPSGALPSDATLNNISNIAKADFRAYSYNQFSLTWNVGPVVMLPQTISSYRNLPGPGPGL